MKVLVVVSALLVASIAQAEMRPPGTFIPRLCSNPATIENGQAVGVKSVCTGDLSETDEEVVQVVTTDGETRDYAVSWTGNRGGGMGSFTARFTGTHLESGDTIKGSLVTTSGITVTQQLKFETESNLSYNGYVEMVFVTLSH